MNRFHVIFDSNLQWESLLPQSHDYSCCVSRRILAPPPPWLQKHMTSRTLRLWHQS